MKAALVDADLLPSFLFGANVRKNSDGSLTIKTSWGESNAIRHEILCYDVFGTNGEEEFFRDFLEKCAL